MTTKEQVDFNKTPDEIMEAICCRSCTINDKTQCRGRVLSTIISKAEERARGEMAKEIDKQLIIERGECERWGNTQRVEEVESIRKIITKLSNHGGGEL